MAFGNSDTVQPGQLVLAIGSPEGLKNSVSIGVVSAVGRDSGTDESATFIQTDAALNPGSSGGALVDTNGVLVGINSFVIADSHGSNQRLGFALPSNLVRAVFEELKNTGYVTYGDLGIKVQNVTSALARGLHILQDSGVIVSDVYPGSPAELGGVEVQDVILSIDGHSLTVVPQLAMSLYGRRIGDLLRLDLLRGSRHLTRVVKIGERSPDPDKLPDSAVVDAGLVPRLGIVCSTLDQSPASAENVRSTTGLLVIAKLSDSISDNELVSGDVIRSINGTEVRSVEDFRVELERLRPGDIAVLHIERRRQFEYLPIEID
jgi:serine protease Do